MSAARTATPTTIAPAIPTERRIVNSNRTRPRSPSRTVSPEKKTARPAVATVTRTAAAIAVVGIARRQPATELLAESAGHQQRVVDTQAEAEECRQVEHEDAHLRQARDDEDRGQRHEHRRPADRERHARGDHRAEDQQEGQTGEGQGDELAPPEVVLRDRLDVAVEGRPAGQLDRDRPAGQAGEPLLDARQGIGRIVGADVEQDHVVRGLPIGRDLARRQLVREDLGDVRRRRDRRHVRGGGRFEGRFAGPGGRARVDEDEGRLGDPELVMELGPGPRRLEVGEVEAAGMEGSRGPRRERQGDEQEDRPGGHDPPPSAVGQDAEALEDRHRAHGRGTVGNMAASYP